MYCPPYYPSDSLSELMEVILDLVLRTPRMMVLGDLNFHAKTAVSRAPQDFMATMMTVGLSQHVIGLTHIRGHKLDLGFSTVEEDGDLKVGELASITLSWLDHFLLRFILWAAFPFCESEGPIKMVSPGG